MKKIILPFIAVFTFTAFSLFSLSFEKEEKSWSDSPLFPYELNEAENTYLLAHGGSQEHIGHYFSYSITLQHAQAREDLLVPFRWTGGGGGIQFGWGYSGETVHLEAELGLTINYLEEHYSNGGALLTPSLVLKGYSRLWDWGTFTVNPGAVFRSRINDAYLFSWDDCHLYYLSSHMLGPAVTLEWHRLNKNILSLGFHLPLVGFIGRPEEERFVKHDGLRPGFLLSEPNSHLRFASPPDYFSFDISLGTEWLFKRSHLKLEYVLDYERYTQPKPFSRLMNSIIFSHNIGFRRHK